MIFIFLLFLLTANIYSETYLNGSYETSFDIRKTSSYKWAVDYPWHRLEARLYSEPIKNFSFFLKTYANVDATYEKDSTKFKREIFQLAESHLNYKIGKKDKVEFYFFANQIRFYLGDPLFYLVNTDKDKWDEDGGIGTARVAGSTIEIEGFIPNFYSKFFIAKMYRQNVDAYGARIYDNIISEKLRLGFTSTYKRWSSNPNDYNLVLASDLFFNIFKNSITFEIAKSKTPSDYSIKNDDLALKVEYRKDFETFLGGLNLIASYRDIGKDFRAYCSKVYDNDRKYDQKGYYFESKYRFPKKAITLTYHRDFYKKKKINYSETEDYIEGYVEFIKDINLKIYYLTTHQFNSDKVEITKLDGSKAWVYLQDDRWSHFFSQISMQDKKTLIKLQFKIRNIKTEYLQYIYGTEISINLTEKLKTLNRFLIVDEIYRTRDTFWSQLQYNFGQNTDFYLEYGNDSYVNDDLVNDKDFVESNNSMEHKIHLYVKLSF
jgi:hypothetical protein